MSHTRTGTRRVRFQNPFMQAAAAGGAGLPRSVAARHTDQSPELPARSEGVAMRGWMRFGHCWDM